jgi:hypothetical protein
MPRDTPGGHSPLATFVACSVTDEDGKLIAVGGEWQDKYGNAITDKRTINQLESQYTKGDYQAGETVRVDVAGDGTFEEATIVVYHGAGTWVVDIGKKRIGIPYEQIRPKE